jgi:hypothetical protein
MAIENWIDEIAKLWGTMKAGKVVVKSYQVFGKAEIPEALSVYPCAITYTTSVNSQYSTGGPCIDIWTGVTELHLCAGVEKQNYPEIMRYFARIRNAAASKMQLNGKVAFFQLASENSIEGPVKFTYGEEAEHLGLLIHWTVKENVTGDFSVSQ